MKNIAVQGCTIQLTDSTSAQGRGSWQITTQPSSKVKADSKGVYNGTITVKVSAYSDSIITDVGSGNGTITINPTSQVTKADSGYVILEGDKGQGVITGTKTSGSSTVTVTSVVTATVKNAGQSKVTSN